MTEREGLDNMITALGGNTNEVSDNLITSKLDKIIEVLGGDPKELKTNLINEKYDKIIELLSNSNNGSNGEVAGPGSSQAVGLTITPRTEEQTQTGLFNRVTVEGDFDLIPANIRKGVNIFGVEGDLVAGASDFNVKLDLTGKTSIGAFISNITEISFLDTSNITNMQGLLQNCSGLITAPEVDASKSTNVTNAFIGCSALKNFPGLKDYGKAFVGKSEDITAYTLNMTACYNLTVESMISILNNLYDLNLTYDVANGGTLYKQSVFFYSFKLTALQGTEEGLQAIENATKKGWKVQS